MEKVIIKKDYSKINTFERIGYTYTKIFEDTKYIVWFMSNGGVEVWKKISAKNSDGTAVEARYIGDEEFGRNGWFLIGKKETIKKQISDKFGICLHW